MQKETSNNKEKQHLFPIRVISKQLPSIKADTSVQCKIKGIQCKAMPIETINKSCDVWGTSKGYLPKPKYCPTI